MTKRSIKSGENVNITRYTPTEWATGDVITAEKLNNIETGIGANETAIGGLDTRVGALESKDFIVTFSGLTADSNAACDKTFAEIAAAYSAGKDIICRWIFDDFGNTGIINLNSYFFTSNNALVRIVGRNNGIALEPDGSGKFEVNVIQALYNSDVLEILERTYLVQDET